jgi:hypothetical protein
MIGATIDCITLKCMQITLRSHIFLYAYFSVPIECWFLLIRERYTNYPIFSHSPCLALLELKRLLQSRT